jgi:protein gp37
MAKGSKIAWTDDTFNIVWGCEKVSPACDNCYAEELDDRYHGSRSGGHWGDNPRMIMADRYWKQPLKWNREAGEAGYRRLVFCSSMADVFETNDQVETQRPRLWELIEQTPHLRWLLLTKRPQNIRRMLPKSLHGASNIWLGTTIENPDYMWRAEKVMEVAAPVHFLSLEPLLAEVTTRDLAKLFHRNGGINWLITGCESGDKSRPTPIDWYRRLRDEAKAYDIDYLFKQAPKVAAGISSGPGSWLKLNRPTAHPDTGQIVQGILEQPYLDGVQHMNFPG